MTLCWARAIPALIRNGARPTTVPQTITCVLRRSLAVGALTLFQTSDASPSTRPLYSYTDDRANTLLSPTQLRTRTAVRELPVTSAMAANGKVTTIATTRNRCFSQGSFRSMGEGEGKVAKKI